LFGFLPVVLLGHLALLRWAGTRAAWLWLVGASFLFYAWWHPPFLLLLLARLAANYTVGRLVSDERSPASVRRAWLAVGVGGNLAVLGWFKYAGFLAANVVALVGAPILSLPEIALPLAISFFTFQQIAYLVDAH